jgi:hypothetical protein
MTGIYPSDPGMIGESLRMGKCSMMRLKGFLSEKPLTPGRHSIRYEFEKTGGAQYGAGGIGRRYVDEEQHAEAHSRAVMIKQ